jgi:hypothetical protein
MQSTLGNQVFTLTGTALGGASYVRQSAQDLALTEDWLQSAIAGNLELVLAPCRAAELIDEDEEWYLCGQEFRIPEIGCVDLLLISESGRIALVETKMSYNPDKRRAVLAQILEYALRLQEVDAGRFLPLPDVSPDSQPSRADLEGHLEDGDFLLIIAGDRIDPRVARLSRGMLGENLTLPWDLALVDVALFERAVDGRTAEPPDRLIVPTLVGRVQPEIRQVVRVSVDDVGDTRVKVEHVPPVTGSEGAARRKWDRAQFEEQIRRAPLRPEFKDLVRSVLTLIDRSQGELTASFGTGDRGSVTLKRHDKGLVELHADGRVWWRPRKFPGALGPSAARDYGDALLRLFPDARGMGIHPHTTVDESARQAGALMEAIKSALTAASTDEASSASSPH